MKKSVAGVLIAGMLQTPTAVTVQAGDADFLAGAIVGGAMGIIAGSVNKSKKTTKRSRIRKKTTISPAQRESNRDIQSRLNSLGYSVGKPDGVLGRKSRAAISAFQRDNGLPVTGKLSNRDNALLYQMSSPSMATGNNYTATNIPGSGPAFPANQNFSANTPANNVFPQIGGAQNQFGTPGAGPNTQFKQNQMPSFGTPAAPVAAPIGATTATLGSANALTKMPAVAGLTGAQDVSAEITTANTDLSFASGKPGILNIALGSSFESALKILEQNGYKDCQGKDEFISCSAIDGPVTESITIGRGLQASNVPVYFMDRNTQIKVDVDQTVIQGKLKKAYPKIAAAPKQVLSNSAECAAYMSELNNIDGFVSALKQLRKQEKPINDWLETSLDVCKEFYKVSVSHDGSQYRVRVVMFDGSYLKSEIERSAQMDIDKVNNVLKF